MGLFSTTTKSTSTEKGTTKPIVPDYAQAPIQGYYNNYNNLFASNNGSAFVTPLTAQQQAAYGTPLSGTNGVLNDAIARVQKLSNFGLDEAATKKATNHYMGAEQAKAGTASAPNRAVLDGLSLADPTKVDLSFLKDYQVEKAAAGQQASGGSAAAGLASDYIDNYKPLADKALVDSTMAEFNDQAGREKAAYAAKAAGAGAFGGSRFGIGEAQLRSDLARKGALTVAEMNDLAYTRALQAAQGDAGNATSANIASANNATQASVANANNSYALNMHNAAQANDLIGMKLGASLQGSLTDASAANQFGLERFREGNANNRTVYNTQADLSKFNAGELNNMAQFNVGETNRNNQFNSAQANQTSQFNAGQRNENNRFNASLGLEGQKHQLNAATTLGNMGLAQGQFARDAATTNATLGNMNWAINQQNQMAPYNYLGMQGELLNPNGLLNTITGQEVEGNSTSKAKNSGGLGSSILGGLFGLGSAWLGRK